MGPRSSDRGYDAAMPRRNVHVTASMGPRSSDRGYARELPLMGKEPESFNGSTVLRPWLCTIPIYLKIIEELLQWVHGPQTVVMIPAGALVLLEGRASMGPRSSDRGYE